MRRTTTAFVVTPAAGRGIVASSSASTAVSTIVGWSSPSRCPEVREKARLRLVAQAVGVADTDCELERQPAHFRRGERRRGRLNANVRFNSTSCTSAGMLSDGAQRVGNATQFLALAILVAAVGERGEQGNRS